jgi:replicative DNA helicase
MKLVNPALEIRVLKTICDGTPKISARVYNAVGDASFYHEPAKEAWRRLKTLMRSHGEIPNWADLVADPAIPEVHRNLLRKDQQKVLNSAGEEKIKSTLRLMEHFRQLRILLEMSQTVLDTLEDESADVDAMMDLVGDQLLLARTKSDATKKMIHIGRGNNADSMIKDLLNPNKLPVVPTGYKAFDDVNGGILLGSLFIIAANTGGGKSTMAINLAHNMSQAGHDVAIVPLEMTEEQMAARLFGLRTEQGRRQL